MGSHFEPLLPRTSAGRWSGRAGESGAATCTSATTYRPYSLAQLHMPLSGAMSVLPSSVREYSTATILDFVSRLLTSPVDSRSLRVLVSMRWETPRRRRRSSPWRWGLPSSENKTLGVHLPMNMEAGVFDSWAIMMSVSCFDGRSCEAAGLLAFVEPQQDREQGAPGE